MLVWGGESMALRRGYVAFFLVLAVFSYAGTGGGFASDLDEELASNNQRIAAIDAEAAPIAAQLTQVQGLIDQHNSEPVDRHNGAAVAAHNARSDQLNGEKQSLIAQLKALSDEQDRLKARNQQLAAASDAIVQSEQDEFDRMNEHWLRAQEELIRQSVSSDTDWREAVLESLDNVDVPDPTYSPMKFGDFLPGDILLFVPENGWNQAIPAVDYIYRVGVDLSRGDVFGAIDRPVAPVSHALTFVKSVNGVTLFLDHTDDGSRMLDRRELARKYQDRQIYVARPQMVVDGQKLWAAAREAALKNTSFGILPGQLVCSERACVTVSKAAGIQLTTHRLGPVDVTPADFFDPAELGKYFIVSPIDERANSPPGQ